MLWVMAIALHNMCILKYSPDNTHLGSKNINTITITANMLTTLDKKFILPRCKKHPAKFVDVTSVASV